MRLRGGRLWAALLLALPLSHAPTVLSAQSSRDSLIAGRRAYEAVDYAAAVRLLPIGLSAAGVRHDSLWTGGVHMLADALLEQGKDTLATFWARWASRAERGFPIDSNVFPPRVGRALLSARAAVESDSTSAADSLVPTTLEPAGDPAAGRGALRLARGGNASAIAIIAGVGTILPGESRTLPASIYTVRLTASGRLPVTITREVLPGFATVLAPRFAPAPALAAGTTPAPRLAPVPTAPVIRGSLLGAAGGTTCAILETGEATCWGDNSARQLGVADTAWHNPVTIADEGFRAVSIGGAHGCALNAGGKAYCWGRGTNGELGNAQTLSGARPVAVSGGQLFVQIAAGGTHTCALTAPGAILCWGANRDGQLGNPRAPTPTSTPTAVALPAGVRFTALTAGAGHTCALAATGALYCWGANTNGQVGNGSTSNAATPTLVQATAPFRAASAGGAHTCALGGDGKAWCWGANLAGQIGAGTALPPNESERPVLVSGGMSFDSIETGDAHSCGLTADGTAYCWGAGRLGQLGNGQALDSPRPALVIGGAVFRTLTLGMHHSCGTSADGITRCWGSNAQGQLGNLAGRSSAAPVPVLVRTPARSAPASAAAPATVRERFSDGNWTAAPAWSADSVPGARFAVREGALDVARQGSRGAMAGAGLALPVRIPVSRATQIQFDVQVLPDSTRRGCGLNCTSWPAVVRLRTKDSDFTESEVWFVFGDAGGTGRRTLDNVVIVARGDAPAGTWLRDQRFTIREALTRADTIVQIWVGGTGGDFAARFDNIVLPPPAVATVDVRPDSIVLTIAVPAHPLRIIVRDSTGADMPARASWWSSDTTIARVDSAGVVTGLKTGRTLVRASVAGTTDSSRVIVRMTAPRRGRRP